MSIGNHLFDKKRKRSSRRRPFRRVFNSVVYPFPNDLFAHLPTIYPDYMYSIVLCCKCPVVDPRHPSLCFSFRIEKKNKMRNMFSFFREQINIIPHAASSPEPCHIQLLVHGTYVKEVSLSSVRPSVHLSIHFRFDFSSNDDHIQMSLLPFVLRSFDQFVHPIIISIDLYDWVLPTVLLSYQWLFATVLFIMIL